MHTVTFFFECEFHSSPIFELFVSLFLSSYRILDFLFFPPQENPCQHPVVILKDINYEDIEAVLCFVYQGTVYISKSRMDSFLKTAESLQIKGLAGASNMMGDNEVKLM